MYDVAVIDDDIKALDYMRTLLVNNININVVELYDNSDDFRKSLKFKDVDIVFIRVEMEALNSIGIARKILEDHVDIKVVLISDTGYYAILAFDLGAEAYLMNPVLDRHIEQLINNMKRRSDCLSITRAPKFQHSLSAYMNNEC